MFDSLLSIVIFTTKRKEVVMANQRNSSYSENEYVNTYCNPTPLPDYPIGRKCYLENYKEICDYRETADPSVIYDNGVWYLYPSCGMVYWSEDFVHWNHERMEPYDAGYAPTVVKHKGKYLLTAFDSDLYVSDHPKGPFKSIGAFRTLTGDVLRVPDPMLFSDDDGRLYLYSGAGAAIRGAELDSDNPTRLITENMLMFEMNTAEHPWERIGDMNEDPSFSWTEGAWMYKRNDTYYLTYSAPGTQWITYAMGAYKSRSPLGPWEYMTTSPFLIKTHGLVRGTGHGCLVDGPNGTVWAFYTCCMGYGGKFERRIGYDPIGFDEAGNIIPKTPTDVPQWAPGVKSAPHLNNGTGLLPLTQHKECSATSCAPGRDALYAVDDSMLSWWQPAENDPLPSLTVKLSNHAMEVRSIRIIWRDVGLDIKENHLPGPFGYTVDAFTEAGEWVCILDKSDNSVDMAVDYNPVLPVRATSVRINIMSSPAHITPGLVNFTVFGFSEF